jgi:hypothetical protein
VAYLAGVLLHEAVHVDQFQRGDHFYDRSAEHAASTVQQVFLDRVGSHLPAYRLFDTLVSEGPADGNPIDPTLGP